MASTSRHDGLHDRDDREGPRIVDGKPFEVVDGRLVKLGPEQWEIDGRDRPALDDHILEFDQPWMLVGGELIEMSPAREPHGRAHSLVATLLETHVAEGYEAFVDLLTRFDADDDFAPDCSVRPLPDPITGQPPLETIAFEIRGEQALSKNTRKARAMVARGVRQVVCLDLQRARVLAWDRAADDWRELHIDEVIVDASLARPLPVAALLDAGQRDAAVVGALRARNAPELEPVREEGRVQGVAIGELRTLVSSILVVLSARGFGLDATTRARIETCAHVDTLRRWLQRAVTAERLEDVFDDG